MNLAQQAFALRAAYPDGRTTLTANHLTWVGSLKPSAGSKTYTVEISAGCAGWPKAKVLSPELHPDGDGRLPHVWDDGTLCLNRVHEWTGKRLMINTVVPWSSEWLFYYELWAATGIWMGDGEKAAADVQHQQRILHGYVAPGASKGGR